MKELTHQPTAPRANARPFAASFRVAIVVIALEALALMLFVDTPAESSEGFASALGRLSAAPIIAALVAAVVARRSKKPWSGGRYVAIVVPVTIGFMLFSAAGRVATSHQWTDADRTGFLRAVEGQGIDSEVAGCVLRQLETSYPDPSEMPNPNSAEFKALATSAITACTGLGK